MKKQFQIDTNTATDNGYFRKFIRTFEHYFSNDYKLGAPPKDLINILSKIALASPAIVALRAYEHLMDKAEVHVKDKAEIQVKDKAEVQAKDKVGVHAKDKAEVHVAQAMYYAARTAWNFRSLFQRFEVTYLLKGLYSEIRAPYWQQVIEYCLDGNLQAVLDEYIHVLKEARHLTNREFGETVAELAKSIESVLKMSYTNLDVDEIITTPRLEMKKQKMRCRYAVRFGEAKDTAKNQESNRPELVREAFNSPFMPFILVSTSIGQEGLDFHSYCHRIYHWNLPANPVDLEQREGRIHRYKGHAVRKNVAKTYGLQLTNEDMAQPWDKVFELARAQREPEDNDLIPYWIYDPLVEGVEKIYCHTMALPLSKEMTKREYLKDALTTYRMVFGQSRQEDLLNYLRKMWKRKNISSDELLPYRVNLVP